MALPEGPPDLNGWTALGAAAATALAWFVYFLKRTTGSPAVNPLDQAFKDGIKKDVARMEATMKDALAHIDRVQEGTNIRVGELTTQVAVVKNEIGHLRKK